MVFVLGCCLFSGEGYEEVARKLAGWLGPLAGPGGWRVPGSCALARARRRVGPAPFELLFSRLAGPLAGPATPGAMAFGRLLAAIDGTTLDVPCTPANIAARGPPPSGSHGTGGYPQARLVTLAGCGTRGVAGAAFGPRTGKGTSEQALARQIAAGGAIRPGTLVLADRNFCGWSVISAITAAGADVLIRGTSRQSLPVLHALPDGSYLSVLADPAASRLRHNRNSARRLRGSALPPDTVTCEGIPVRVIEAVITTRAPGGPPRTTRCRLVTTLLDPVAAPALELAACYAQRWEIETGYREIKVSLRGPGRVLRSRDPDGVRQEIRALLCAAQLTHAARARAAARDGLDPDQVSFTITLRAIRRAATATRRQPAATEILARLLPPRRPRSYPRSRAGHGGPATCTITIQAPDP
jgi:Transposase DDE domain/Insertion element 4 transposase N-terminal